MIKLIEKLKKIAQDVNYGNVTLQLTISRGEIKKIEVAETTKIILLDKE